MKRVLWFNTETGEIKGHCTKDALRVEPAARLPHREAAYLTGTTAWVCIEYEVFHQPEFLLSDYLGAAK